MSFNEKPPMLTGQTARDLSALRDYLFRMANTLDQAGIAPGVPVTRAAEAKAGALASADAVKAVRENARELKALILKTAREVYSYADSKVEEYNALYAAKSDYGTFKETIQSRIETTARGVVESYGYDSLITSAQDSIDLLQTYLTHLDGEIRRGIVLDPETNEYVIGIAISRHLTFTGACGPSDQHNPGDGYTYYYLTAGQTFGLYTSTGWQFWIDGCKKGWFSAVDGMLHVANVAVEDNLQLGGHWRFRERGGMLEILYLEE